MSDTLTSLRRTPFQSLTSFLVLCFTVFLTLVLVFGMLFLFGLLRKVELQPQVIVYFQPKTPESDIFAIRESLVSSDKVEKIEYISKQKAFQIYKSQAIDNPLLLEMTSADIFPPSLEIQAKDPAYLSEIESYLKKQAGIDEVQYQKNTVNKLLQITRVLRIVAIVTAVYLAIMTTLVLTALTMFKIALRKDEIELYQLLGATSASIRGPINAEGLFLATTATLVAWLAFVGITLSGRLLTIGYMQGLDINWAISEYKLGIWPVSIPLYLLIFLGALIYASVISLIASRIAAGRYVK